MISDVNFFGLDTRKARPCGSHDTMDGLVRVSVVSMDISFSGKGCVTPPVFLRTKPSVSGIWE